ncbi:DNA-binding transcriptional ArsR family regulator [Crossiella equi]|uniref:DNA-binding transcriptional ArsR family regulator n=1 Tax=Crossiella equi TaxID=130796 RepID=A0ABS5APF7_9PSEU|nr:helix-turn-helix domain-containing protein [Crossiella equi]MBP2478454.1 DNA-binding transcriptional ArsR family regulator [Crossiella equi]
MNTVDLLLHPVRLRITHAMSGGRTRTTQQLCASLADVPKTSVYRHVGLLAEAGVLEVVEERRVHGAVERHYRMRQGGNVVAEDAARAMSLEEHRQGFTAAMAVLLAEFNAYLDREGANPPADLVGYKQGVLWLSPEEQLEVARELLAVLRARADNKPTPERVPRLFSAIFFPTSGEQA